MNTWGTPAFEGAFKQEAEQLHVDLLPLQQGLSFTSSVTDSPRRVLIHRVIDEGASIQIRAGIFYSGILSGCSCADDPTAVEEQNEYCEVLFEINKKTAEATVALLVE